MAENRSAASQQQAKLRTRRARRSGGGSIRRLFLLGVVLIALVAAIKVKFPVQLDAASWMVRKTINAQIYSMTFKFTGLERLRAEDLEVIMPTAKPFWWWLSSGPTVESSLLQNPLVKQASFSRCTWYSVKCFTVKIIERAPSAIISLQERFWLVGEDGGVIGPVSKSGVTGSLLPTISGLERFEATPQILRDRLLLVLQLFSSLKKPSTGVAIHPVKTVAFFGDSDVLVTRATETEAPDYVPEVVFALVPPEHIGEQVERLAEVEAQLGSKLLTVQRIDLAFQSQAVITFKAPTAEPALVKKAGIVAPNVRKEDVIAPQRGRRP